MRDQEVVDSGLRLLAAVRRSIREHRGKPSSGYSKCLIDQLAAVMCGRSTCSA